jgi:hypothetical protein
MSPAPQSPPGVTDTGRYSIRHYPDEDFEMILEWVKQGEPSRTFDRSMLPPMGIIVERDKLPVCACWCHEVTGARYAILDAPILRSGIDGFVTVNAVKQAVEFFEEYLRARGHGTMIAMVAPCDALNFVGHDFTAAGEWRHFVKTLV